MNKTCNVVAVVVYYGRPVELLQVVSSLLSQTFPPAAVLVWDNASRLPASQLLADYKGVEVVRSQENLGGAGGFSLGLAKALESNPDWVWLLDDDAVPEISALEELLRASEFLPNNTGALCSAVKEFGVIALMHRRFYDRTFAIESHISENHYDVCSEIDTGSFVGFMVRSHAVKNVGLPNADFFLAYDDTEYSLRFKSYGWSIWLAPRSVINHLRVAGSRLSGSTFGNKHYYNVRNRIIVAKRYSRFGIFSSSIVGVLIWLSSASPFNKSSYSLFIRAIRDGCQVKLGRLEE